MVEPQHRDRPRVPAGYGAPAGTEGLLEWSVVEARLVEALHYWMATTRPSGRPHVVPRWGAWLNGSLYYDGSPDTVHSKNVVSNDACALHVGDGTDVVLVDGTTRASTPVAGTLSDAISAEIGRKYRNLGYAPPPDSWAGSDAGGLMIFTPAKALAWFDFPKDLTRFRFD